ncbi:MAG: hypothetical protein L3K09_06995 [Thermoplasmata archaeon]|nr:hypothetical protein [Thermoplasmata archaeon]
MIQRELGADRGVLVVGAVRGSRKDALELSSRLRAHRPLALGLGISFEELTGLRDYFVGTDTEPLVPLTGNEVAEMRGLVAFGEVSVPNPAYLAALEFAKEQSLPVEAVDPTDDHYANLFTSSIGYLELVRRTLRERRLTRRPPAASSADEYAVNWERESAPGRGSKKFQLERDAAAVDAARRLIRVHPRIALIFDRERFERVLTLLEKPAPAARLSSAT